MNYIDQITDRLGKLLSDCPDDQLLRYYALLILAKGTSVTAEDIHDAWSAWMTTVRPDHRSLVSFRDLPPEVQAHDEVPLRAVRAVAEAILAEGE